MSVDRSYGELECILLNSFLVLVVYFVCVMMNYTLEIIGIIWSRDWILKYVMILGSFMISF
jgi:hypothetical protein